MAEHGGRYSRFAEACTARGIELWAADMRGHGKTADPAINGPGKGGLLGHTSDKDGFFRPVQDISVINKYIAGVYGEKKLPPFFLMGHSWGSFLTQAYIEELGLGEEGRLGGEAAGGPPLAGCALSGTRGPGKFGAGADAVFGAPFLAVLAALTGKRKPSRLASGMAFGPYNKPFRPNRTAVDWLSRDEKEVDDYIADPLCGMICSAGFFSALLGGLKIIHKKKRIAAVPRELPVYVFCGSADPVGAMGAGPTNLVNAYRSNGVSDLEFSVYPDARHETLNETNRDEVTDDFINWLLRHAKE
jgi:alpha-beta hydrolase superfamily lysophospholipase